MKSFDVRHPDDNSAQYDSSVKTDSRLKHRILSHVTYMVLGVSLSLAIYGLQQYFAPQQAEMHFTYKCYTKDDSQGQSWCKKYKVFDDGSKTYVSRKLGACPNSPSCPF